MITDDIKAALEGTTPGPWYSHDGEAYVHVRSEADRILICEISWHSSIRLHHPLKSESQANAKLFAAAPDLLTRALSEIESLQAQLHTCIEQAAAEAREQMRDECIDKITDHYHTGNGFGLTNADQRCADIIKEIP